MEIGAMNDQRRVERGVVDAPDVARALLIFVRGLHVASHRARALRELTQRDAWSNVFPTPVHADADGLTNAGSRGEPLEQLVTFNRRDLRNATIDVTCFAGPRVASRRSAARRPRSTAPRLCRRNEWLCLFFG